jgi:RimJ/RimL family protein N-acetyltransferase
VGYNPRDTMANEPPNSDNFMSVKTTLPTWPLPSNQSRPSITTERLILRPLQAEDIRAFHALRSQPQVMKWTKFGVVDADVAESQKKLDMFLPPNDAKTFNYAICLRESGKLIGVGGCHSFPSKFGWPEVGYMFSTEVWGQGLATEFLLAFLAAWSELPREEAVIQVDPRTALVLGADGAAGTGDGHGLPCVEEQMIAVTEENNVRSQRTLRKAAFEYVLTWKTRNEHIGDTDREFVDLPTFRIFPGMVAK